MSADTFCKYFKFGYCKFGLTCHKQHEENICENASCYIEKCRLRHPRFSCKDAKGDYSERQ